MEDRVWAYNTALECAGVKRPAPNGGWVLGGTQADGDFDLETALLAIGNVAVVAGAEEDTASGRDRVAMRVMGAHSTQKRTLAAGAHAKAHSAIPRSHRLRFSVTLRRPESVGQPPARLRGTMENSSTGQMRSSNRPPACGAGCARVRKSRSGV